MAFAVSVRHLAVITAAAGLLLCSRPFAATPTAQDVDVYSSLCKIGSETTFGVAGELGAILGAIARRILAGEAKLSASKLQDEFPGIRDEKNRLLALQSFQDCMYRYVERFHAAAGSAQPARSSGASVIVGPNVSAERRREIVFLANELESFKQKMSKGLAAVPATFYDKRDSTEKRPREDQRLIGLADFSRYKAFQAASGGLDFSNATNNDIVILCDTYGDEVAAYHAFNRQYHPLGLPAYSSTNEVRRICGAAARGR